jgi:hypothetical protein
MMKKIRCFLGLHIPGDKVKCPWTKLTYIQCNICNETLYSMNE